MNILHVIATLDKMQGGPPPVVVGMCEAMAARGHQVTLYANQSSRPIRTTEQTSFRLKYFPLDWEPYQVSLAMARSLRDLCRFDLVHIHMLYRFPQAIAALYARRQRVPYCIQPHGALAPTVYHGKRSLLRKAYVAAVERRNINASAGMIFTASQELAWARAIGLDSNHPYIVPVGADIRNLARRADGTVFRNRYNISDHAMLLWMGRLVESKGLELLMSAFAAALRENPGMCLVLAGPDTGSYQRTLERHAQNLGITRSVVFTGMIDGEEKQRALCAADLFVLPSLSENFSLATLEAMAVGCPVLLSPGVCIADDVATAGAGRVVPRDVSHWKMAIVELVANRSARIAMGGAAAKVARQYDWSIVAQRLENSYLDMAIRR